MKFFYWLLKSSKFIPVDKTIVCQPTKKPMQTEIIISDNCKTCSYVEFAAIPFMNTFQGQWKCRLFNQNLFLNSGAQATLKNEQPEQCGDCRILIKRHLDTPEFQG